MQRKAAEQNVPAVLFITLYNVGVTLELVDKILELSIQ